MRHAAMLVFALCAVATTARAEGDAAAELTAARAALPACDPARAHCLGIHLHVTAGDGHLIVSAEWLAAQLAAANHHFAPLDVAFQVVQIDALPARAAHVATRRDRNALAADRLHDRVLHVFVVGQLDDVDAIGETRSGVAWHTPGSDRKYVILASKARERVMAHELGHVFGLPHSSYPISIMNKTERSEPPSEQRTFADDEITAMRSGLAQLLRDHMASELPHPAPAAPSPPPPPPSAPAPPPSAPAPPAANARPRAPDRP